MDSCRHHIDASNSPTTSPLPQEHRHLRANHWIWKSPDLRKQGMPLSQRNHIDAPSIMDYDDYAPVTWICASLRTSSTCKLGVHGAHPRFDITLSCSIRMPIASLLFFVSTSWYFGGPTSRTKNCPSCPKMVAHDLFTVSPGFFLRCSGVLKRTWNSCDLAVTAHNFSVGTYFFKIRIPSQGISTKSVEVLNGHLTSKHIPIHYLKQLGKPCVL